VTPATANARGFSTSVTRSVDRDNVGVIAVWPMGGRLLAPFAAMRNAMAAAVAGVVATRVGKANGSARSADQAELLFSI
jgi:hypothetical protein